ncbi:MAG: hypothetical protein R6X27_03500 [Candidatus Desulfacyla sp.]
MEIPRLRTFKAVATLLGLNIYAILNDLPFCLKRVEIVLESFSFGMHRSRPNQKKRLI